MIASLDVAVIAPAPTFWIWRLIDPLPTETTPFDVSFTKLLAEKVVLPMVKSDTALAAAVTDESPIATSPSAVFAVAPRPNANDLSLPALATAPRAVACSPPATAPRPILVALTPFAAEFPPIEIDQSFAAVALKPNATDASPVAFAF